MFQVDKGLDEKRPVMFSIIVCLGFTQYRKEQ